MVASVQPAVDEGLLGGEVVVEVGLAQPGEEGSGLRGAFHKETHVALLSSGHGEDVLFPVVLRKDENAWSSWRDDVLSVDRDGMTAAEEADERIAQAQDKEKGDDGSDDAHCNEAFAGSHATNAFEEG